MSRRIETAFLPAALEIQDTAPSPAGRAILWTILAVFCLAIVWASVSEVDIVAVAKGRIIPSGHSKTVQPLELGTVREILVEEGQAVAAGEVLIRLDDSAARADVTQLANEIAQIERELSRTKALDQLLTNDPSISPETAQLIRQSDDALLIHQWRAYQDQVAVLEGERDTLIAQQSSSQRQVDKLEAVLPIVTKRTNVQKGLVEKKIWPEQRYLETEQQRLETFHDLRTQRGRIEELNQQIRAIDAQIVRLRSDFHRQVVETQEDAMRRLAATGQALIKAKARLRARTITAPVDGTVQQLTIHSIGAIVTPAQVLMMIVPTDETLMVEAELLNKDIGFVEAGQPVEVKVDTFPFTKYGTIDGEVIDLSNDAVADERKGLVYKLRVLMERSAMEVNGKSVTLSPGMTVTVESKTGTRRLIEFFLSPLLRFRDESARER